MLEKYDEFKNKNKDINKKIAGLKKQKLQVKFDKFNKQKQELQKRMSIFVAGSSNYS